MLEDAALDYEAFIAALAARGFDGFVCLELVKDSLVETPVAFDLDRVLEHAQQDRDFVLRAAARCGMVISG